MPAVSQLTVLGRAIVADLLILAVVTCQDHGPVVHRARGISAVSTDSTGPVTFVGAGDIADCGGFLGDERTAALLDTIPGTVFTIGDNAYPNGSDADYANCYAPTWGRHKARTKPAVGNHEYYLGNADATWRYWGQQAGDSGKYYYSYDLGAWHIIVLNAEDSYVSASAGSPQELWLRADLAATNKRCIIAMWHEPRFYSSFSSGSVGFRPYLSAFWSDLYNAGAAIILNGHSHNYERFAPQDPAGNVDTLRGVVEFIVGTGGQKAYRPDSSIRVNSVVRGGDNGVIKFTLSDAGYSWQFIPVARATFTDSGSGMCPGNQPPVARPGGPYKSESAVAFDGSASSDPNQNVPLSYAWDFGDGATGTGVAPTHTYAAEGVYTVTLVVTDTKGLASQPATTTASIANQPPVVHAGADAWIPPGGTYRLSATFSDPGGAGEAPWAYTIAWGDGATDTGSTSRQDLPITASHTYVTAGSYAVLVDVTDKDGGTGSGGLSVLVDPTPPPMVVVGAGDIARCDRTNDEATAAALDTISGTVFTTGDHVYATGSLADFTTCYGPSWGRHQARTRPVVGDKDYLTTDAAGYFQYFGAAAAGDSGKYYYSYDVGGWHIVVLNSSISTSAGSLQERWLKADLAASAKKCTLAIWHYPRFSSTGTAVRSGVKPLWDDLYAAGAELVLNGHYNVYERFAPQDPAGVANANGIRQFTVGTGGQGTTSFDTPLATSELRNTGTYGVLKLTLSAGGYAWAFVPAGSGTFRDSGSTACH